MMIKAAIHVRDLALIALSLSVVIIYLNSEGNRRRLDTHEEVLTLQEQFMLGHRHTPAANERM